MYICYNCLHQLLEMYKTGLYIRKAVGEARLNDVVLHPELTVRLDDWF